jgi:hypothetical protein
MTFAAVARAATQADLSLVTAVAIDETACRRGHDYLTIAADADERKVVFVIEGRDATTIARFAEDLATHKVSARGGQGAELRRSSARRRSNNASDLVDGAAGSGGGADGIGGLPVPGQQFGDAFGRVVGNAREDVGEIGLRIEAVELCRLDQ